jgi:hypothetical protein
MDFNRQILYRLPGDQDFTAILGRTGRGTPANLDFRAMMPKISMVVALF